MEQPSNCTVALPYVPEGDSLDALMVVLEVFMGLLTGFLLVLSLLGRLSGAATTHHSVRFFLWVISAVFLPLTSHMFSEAEKSAEPDFLRPQLVLLWMLLAEILRKKLEAVSPINASRLQGVNKQSAWDAVDQNIIHFMWLGYLIYTYAVQWVFVVLWAFSIVKIAQRFVQRVAAVKVTNRSFALGENPQLIAGYMRQLSEEEAEEQQETAATGEEEKSMSTVMMACKYVIMGEDKVKRKEDPHGYSLQLSDAKEREKMVTVGDVWRLAASGGDALFSSERLNLKDLCLSFALYKLLQRRFKEHPCAEAGSRQSLNFLLCGLLGDDKVYSPHDRRSAEERKGQRVFRVIEDELSFLRDFYFSTIPLRRSNLWFFLLDFVLEFVIPLFCWILIFVHIVIDRCGILRRLFNLLMNMVTVSISYNLIVTLLLIGTLFLLDLAEVVFYMLSDWVVVSLLCTYAKKKSWRRSMSVLLALSLITQRMVKTSLKRASFRFNQHSILERPRGRFLNVQSTLLKIGPYRRYLGVRWTPVPKEVKAAIVKYLVDSSGCGPVLPIGESVLRRNGAAGEELLQACKSDGTTEMIIVWHIATCLYEMKHPSLPLSWLQPRQSDDHDTQANRRIAETLSKYCAYLVARNPELLPDNAAGTTTAYKAAVKDIQDALLEQNVHKADDFERVTSIKNANGTVAKRGMELGHQLDAVRNERLVWKVLAELWTEIMVYIAPSDDVKSHEQALADGGEFITHVWALLTHGGILRWPTADENAPPPPPPPADHESPV